MSLRILLSHVLIIGLGLSFTAPIGAVETELRDKVCNESLAEANWLSQYPNLEQMYADALELAIPSDHPTLSIVIPAYREEKRIAASIQQLKAFFNRYPYYVEILIRIEKSPDDTVGVTLAEVNGDPRFVVSAHEVQKGKGYAVRQGMLAARGDYILFMDTDLSTPLPEIYHFLSQTARGQGADVLIGDRYDPRLSTVEKKAWYRKVQSSVFSGLVNQVLASYGLRGIHDTQCGFKMFTRAATEILFPRAQVNGFAFDVELLLMAAQLKLGIAQVPVHWKDDPRSTVNPLTDPFKMLWDIRKMSLEIRSRGLSSPIGNRSETTRGSGPPFF